MHLKLLLYEALSYYCTHRLAAPPPRLMWKYPLHYKDVEAQLLAKTARAKQ
jgi:hypothetical protein